MAGSARLESSTCAAHARATNACSISSRESPLGTPPKPSPHDLAQRRAVFRVARCTASDRDHKRPGADAHAGGFGRSSDQLCLDSFDALGLYAFIVARLGDGAVLRAAG